MNAWLTWAALAPCAVLTAWLFLDLHRLGRQPWDEKVDFYPMLRRTAWWQLSIAGFLMVHGQWVNSIPLAMWALCQWGMSSFGRRFMARFPPTPVATHSAELEPEPDRPSSPSIGDTVAGSTSDRSAGAPK